MCRAGKIFCGRERKKESQYINLRIGTAKSKNALFNARDLKETFSAPLHTAAITPKFLITSGNFHIDLLHTYNYK